jgi:purine-nucleoside phosphorylase
MIGAAFVNCRRTTDAPMNEADLAERAAQFLQRRWKGFQPRTLIGLGSGLGEVCRDMTLVDEVAFSEVPGFAPPTVAGHAGRIRVGEWSGELVLVLLGRMHLYEGHSIDAVVHPIRTAALLGVQNILLTNMSGGMQSDWKLPLLALVDAHRDLQHGWVGGFRGDPIDCYSQRLKNVVMESTSEGQVALRRGVYAGLTGPSYETPAEIRALRGLGCDMVGMSTVQEARVANELGLACCAVSCVSNFAAGVTNEKVDHADVVEAGRKIAPALTALLGAVLKRIANDESR